MTSRRHRPQQVSLSPLAHLMPLPKPERDRRALRLLSAIDTIASGSHPGRDEWEEVASAINRIDTVVSSGRLVVEDRDATMALIVQAEEGLQAAAARYRRGKPMRLDGVALEALREIARVWLWCVDHWTEGDVWRAERDTIARIVRMSRDKTIQVVTLEGA
jgi:hypothetical protein